MADRYIEVLWGSNNNHYANVDLIANEQVFTLFRQDGGMLPRIHVFRRAWLLARIK